MKTLFWLRTSLILILSGMVIPCFAMEPKKQKTVRRIEYHPGFELLSPEDKAYVLHVQHQYEQLLAENNRLNRTAKNLMEKIGADPAD